MPKFNTETYYEMDRFFTKLKNLPGVQDVILDNKNLILVSKINNRLIKVVEIIRVKTVIVNDLTYVKLDDINALYGLSRKTKPSDIEDEMYLIGDDDTESDVEVVDRGLLKFDKPKPTSSLKAKSKLLQTKKPKL